MYESFVRNFSTNIKKFFSKPSTRPGLEKRNLQTIEMRMLRKICGKTLRDGMSNQTIRDMTDVDKIEEIIREQRIKMVCTRERMNNERTPVKTKNE